MAMPMAADTKTAAASYTDVTFTLNEIKFALAGCNAGESAEGKSALYQEAMMADAEQVAEEVIE